MYMSIGRDLLGKFGIIAPMKPEIASAESLLKVVRPSIGKARVGAARRWSSESNSREFQSRELARRAVGESLARIPVAR
jgi:hypothetical protein